MGVAMIETTKALCVGGKIEEADRRPPRVPLVAVDQDTTLFPKRSVNEIQRAIHDLLRNIIWIVRIDEIENQSISPIGDQILGIVLGRRTPPIAESLSMVWLPAGMNNPPATLVSNVLLVIVLAADKQFWMDFNHALAPQSTAPEFPTSGNVFIFDNRSRFLWRNNRRNSVLDPKVLLPRTLRGRGTFRPVLIGSPSKSVTGRNGEDINSAYRNHSG
jgi:hypothetical protein